MAYRSSGSNNQELVANLQGKGGGGGRAAKKKGQSDVEAHGQRRAWKRLAAEALLGSLSSPLSCVLCLLMASGYGIVRSARILEALRRVDRGDFVPGEVRREG